MTDQNKPSIMKSVLYSLPVVVLAAVCCFFAISPAFDKTETPNPNPKPTPGQEEPAPQPVGSVTAVNLWASYIASTTDADRQYKGQIFEISGTLSDYGYNAEGQYYYCEMMDGNVIFKLKAAYGAEAMSLITEGAIVIVEGKVDGIENGKLYISDAWSSSFEVHDAS